MAVSTADTEFLDPALLDGELGRLGPYRVTGVLGVGGMGQVFQAEDTRLRRTVAIKVMNRKFASTNHSRKRFVEEARSMAAVHHDNVAMIFEVGQHRRTPFMAMELLQGCTVEQQIQNGRRFDHFEIIEIAKQTALGLDAAHQRGIVHRDIKPANLWMQSPQDRIKILDFGLALAGNGIDQFSGVGSVVGTLGYLSPEQACNDPVDERTDLYGLGVVLYQLCTGQLPCLGTNVASQLIAIINTPPIPFANRDVDIPTPLSELIIQLLSKDPSHRVSTAMQLVQRLSGVAEEIRSNNERSLEIKVAPEAPGSAKSRKRSKRRLSKALSAPFSETQTTPAAPVSLETTEIAPSDTSTEIETFELAESETTEAELPETLPLEGEPTESETLPVDRKWTIVPIASAVTLITLLGGYLWWRPDRAAQEARVIQNDSSSSEPTPAPLIGETSLLDSAATDIDSSVAAIKEVTAATIAPIVLSDQIEGERKTTAGNFALFNLQLINQATSENDDPRVIHKDVKKVATLITYLQQDGSSKVEQPAFPQHFSAKRLPKRGASTSVAVQFLTQDLTPGKYTVRFELQTPSGRKTGEIDTELTIARR